MSKKIEPEEMLKRVFRVAEILATSEVAFHLMDISTQHTDQHTEKREKSPQKNTNS